MTADEFRGVLAALGMSQRGFAAYTGANERTVRRWALGEQDIPPWVPVLIRLLERVAASG
jgi:DNA-binding transcriptional regulator YiaG